MSEIKDPLYSGEGRLRVEWASREMPVVSRLTERFRKEKSFRGIRISGCLHLTTETANAVLALKAGEGDIVLCASNPLSTQDDVTAYLVEEGVNVYGIKGEDNETYYRHIDLALAHKPHITLDDGGDLISAIHKRYLDLAGNILGGTEMTTTGVVRERQMEKEGILRYPLFAVNEAQTKHLFDNRYGSGQSTIDGITRATNILWAGKKVVVCGYGWCGRGVAMRARGMGSQVIVTEVDPIKALEAAMDGLEVIPALKAARLGDIFITVTGGVNAINKEHLEVMKDGAIMANSGHFDCEINLAALEEMKTSTKEVRPGVVQYFFSNGRSIFLLAEGRLVNLACAEGHPASVMDMSFANHLLCAEYLVKRGERLSPGVYSVPYDVDCDIGRLKLSSMGVEIDHLTPEQENYIQSWEGGT